MGTTTAQAQRKTDATVSPASKPEVALTAVELIDAHVAAFNASFDGLEQGDRDSASSEALCGLMGRLDRLFNGKTEGVLPGADLVKTPSGRQIVSECFSSDGKLLPTATAEKALIARREAMVAAFNQWAFNPTDGALATVSALNALGDTAPGGSVVAEGKDGRTFTVNPRQALGLLTGTANAVFGRGTRYTTR